MFSGYKSSPGAVASSHTGRFLAQQWKLGRGEEAKPQELRSPFHFIPVCKLAHLSINPITNFSSPKCCPILVPSPSCKELISHNHNIVGGEMIVRHNH